MHTFIYVLKSSLGQGLKWLLNNAFISQGTPFYFQIRGSNMNLSHCPFLHVPFAAWHVPQADCVRQTFPLWDPAIFGSLLTHCLFIACTYSGSQLNHSQLPVFCCYLPRPALTQLCNSVLCSKIFSVVKKNGVRGSINRLSFKSLHNSLA